MSKKKINLPDLAKEAEEWRKNQIRKIKRMQRKTEKIRNQIEADAKAEFERKRGKINDHGH